MSKVKILIVEDDAITARDLERTLCNFGYDVTALVSTCKQAFKSAQENPPDLVLMDIILDGEQNGIEAARQIRSCLNIPIVYITVYSDEKTMEAARVTDPFGYIIKPIDEGELHAAIEIAICKHALQKKLEEALRESKERYSMSHSELSRLSQHLQSIKEEESKRISREIHDELGQALTALKIDLSLLSKRLTETPKNKKNLLQRIKSMSALIDKTVLMVQQISSELRPGMLDDLGLVPAIEWQAQDFQARTRIKCKVDFDSFDFDISPECSTAVFRAFQEALTNIARHAQATKVGVSLKVMMDKLVLKIRDNGKGIAEADILSPESLGILGVRERIRPFGGELELNGALNKGTTVSIAIPIDKLCVKEDSQKKGFKP